STITNTATATTSLFFTTTLPGTTVVQTLPPVTTVLTLPGAVTTIIAPGTTVVSTLPGVVTTTTLPGIVTTITSPPITTTVRFPGTSVTLTQTLACTARAAPTRPSRSVPKDYTWGCAPGYICNPKDRCDTEPPPADGYLCEPDECEVAPPLCPYPDDWGHDFTSKKVGTWLIQPPYYPLDPGMFGLDWSIFSILERRSIEDSVTMTKRQSGTQFSACYDECDSANVNAQNLGKTARLCLPDSAFKVAYRNCQKCFAFHASTAMPQQMPVTSVEPIYRQYINYCNANFPETTSTSGATSSRTSSSPQSQATSSSAPASTLCYTFCVPKQFTKFIFRTSFYGTTNLFTRANHYRHTHPLFLFPPYITFLIYGSECLGSR
ncbi:unnamed protein product, partial [Tuber aestivum]